MISHSSESSLNSNDGYTVTDGKNVEVSKDQVHTSMAIVCSDVHLIFQFQSVYTQINGNG